jgi:dipeptidyl-peptidase-4
MQSSFGNSSSLSLSPDGSKVLIRYSPRQIFRHSTVARYAVAYMNDLSVSFKVNNGEEIQVCVFTPNSNGILYIRDNTMYYATDMLIRQEESERISAIGQPGVIYHGIPDWVYEEEVLGSATAAWFSPDGKYVAYASFDDTNVRDFMYELYGDGKGEYQYPKEVHLRYPKVGERNPIVTLSIEDLSIGGINPIVLPAPDEVKVNNLYGEEDHVLGIVFWISNTRVGAIWLNRRQNKGIFAAYNQDINGWTYEKVRNKIFKIKMQMFNLINIHISLTFNS